MTLLYHLHGEYCKRPGCDQPLEFKEKYVGTCLVVNWRCNAGHFGGRWPLSWKFAAGIINYYVRKLIQQNWLSVQDYEHDIHFQDAIQPVSKFVYFPSS